jgi:WD40 repeat protein
VLRSAHTFGVTSLGHLNETTGLLCLDSKPYPSLRTMPSQLDFIRSYNHTLSSTFSHPSLPLTHHSRNRSLCSSVIPLPTALNALALSPDETLLAVAAGSDVLVYSTEDNMSLTHTLQGHTGRVTSVEWYPNGEKKLVSGSSVDGMHREEVVWFWDLKEDSPTEAKIDLECTATGARAVAAEPLVLQAGRISNQDSGSQAQPSFLTSSQRAYVFKRDASAQVVPLLRLVDICLVYLQSYLASG